MEQQNTMDDLRASLCEFFGNNPDSKLIEKGGSFSISMPWNIPSIELAVSLQEKDLLGALNEVCLPQRFTAIYHRKLKSLEVIWTGFYLANHDEHNRCFDFFYNKKKHKCGFRAPSSNLLRIAAAYRMCPDGSTDNRNLESFKLYQELQQLDPESVHLKKTKPICFWVEEIEWEENYVVGLARHINFYLRYFDKQSPMILIHEAAVSEQGQKQGLRYPYGKFPDEIAAHQVDSYLLGLWEGAANANDPFRRFLYSYQILEYASFYYLDETTTQAVRRALKRPDAQSSFEETVAMILDATVGTRIGDDDRIMAVLRQCVEPEILWDEIEPSRDYFSQPIYFDGGFALEPFIKKDWGLEDFKMAWMPKYAYFLRKIRNALVHSRESRMSTSIAPTRINHKKLQPWIAPLSNTAMQIILFHK